MRLVDNSGTNADRPSLCDMIGSVFIGFPSVWEKEQFACIAKFGFSKSPEVADSLFEA